MEPGGSGVSPSKQKGPVTIHASDGPISLFFRIRTDAGVFTHLVKHASIFQIRCLPFKFLTLRMSLPPKRFPTLGDMH